MPVGSEKLVFGLLAGFETIRDLLIFYVGAGAKQGVVRSEWRQSRRRSTKHPGDRA